MEMMHYQGTTDHLSQGLKMIDHREKDRLPFAPVWSVEDRLCWRVPQGRSYVGLPVRSHWSRPFLW
uniref:Uncharacterized protein n=1 Tax=Anguilla anguilla TaxID=7936 RepID=A0A0E9W614_ANGAN